MRLAALVFLAVPLSTFLSLPAAAQEGDVALDTPGVYPVVGRFLLPLPHVPLRPPEIRTSVIIAGPDDLYLRNLSLHHSGKACFDFFPDLPASSAAILRLSTDSGRTWSDAPADGNRDDSHRDIPLPGPAKPEPPPELPPESERDGAPLFGTSRAPSGNGKDAPQTERSFPGGAPSPSPKTAEEPEKEPPVPDGSPAQTAPGKPSEPADERGDGPAPSIAAAGTAIGKAQAPRGARTVLALFGCCAAGAGAAAFAYYRHRGRRNDGQ